MNSLDSYVGVVFNDLTKLLLLADGSNIHYIDFEHNEVKQNMEVKLMI